MRFGNAHSTNAARSPRRPRAAFHSASVGPVSPEKRKPVLPSWTMKPEVGTVVEMRMRDERVLDLRLLGQGERATDRAGIDQDAVVDEEGRGALTESFGSVGAEHSNLHSRPILA